MFFTLSIFSCLASLSFAIPSSVSVQNGPTYDFAFFDTHACRGNHLITFLRSVSITCDAEANGISTAPMALPLTSPFKNGTEFKNGNLFMKLNSDGSFDIQQSQTSKQYQKISVAGLRSYSVVHGVPKPFKPYEYYSHVFKMSYLYHDRIETMGPAKDIDIVTVSCGESYITSFKTTNDFTCFNSGKDVAGFSDVSLNPSGLTFQGNPTYDLKLTPTTKAPFLQRMTLALAKVGNEVVVIKVGKEFTNEKKAWSPLKTINHASSNLVYTKK